MLGGVGEGEAANRGEKGEQMMEARRRGDTMNTRPEGKGESKGKTKQCILCHR